MASNYSIANMDQIFAPQEQAAEDSRQALYEQIFSAPKGDTMSSLLGKLAQVPSVTAPQLQLKTNATGIGTGVVEGLGNAVNNAFQLRQFGQEKARQKQYQQQLQGQIDLVQKRDLADAQHKADLAKGQEDYISTLPADLQPIYRQADAVGRRAILDKLASPFLAKGLGKAAGTQKVAEVATLREGSGVPVGAENTGALTPQQINALTAHGLPAKDLLDYNERLNKGITESTKAQAQPTLTAQEIEKNNLGLQSDKLNNVLKNIQVQFEPERLRSNIEGQQLTNKEKADKLLRIDTAEKVFHEFQDRLARGEVTAEDIASVQSNIGLLTNLDPTLDKTLKSVLGLKADDKLDTNKLKTLFQQQTSVTQPKANVQGMKALGHGYYQDAQGNIHVDTDVVPSAQPKAKNNTFTEKYGNIHKTPSSTNSTTSNPTSPQKTVGPTQTYTDAYGSAHAFNGTEAPLAPFWRDLGKGLDRFLMNNAERSDSSLGGY